MLEGGFLSFSMACSTENEPGLWRGGNCWKLMQMLPDDRLRGNEHEGVLDEPLHIVAGFVLGPLERVGSQVEQRSAIEAGSSAAARPRSPCAFCSMNTAFHWS